jgi:hypothetical protein
MEIIMVINFLWKDLIMNILKILLWKKIKNLKIKEKNLKIDNLQVCLKKEKKIAKMQFILIMEIKIMDHWLQEVKFLLLKLL